MHTQTIKHIDMGRLKEVFQRCTCPTTTGGGSEEGWVLHAHRAALILFHRGS